MEEPSVDRISPFVLIEVGGADEGDLVSLNRFAERASCPEGCLVAQPSNLGLGRVPELPIPAP